MSTRKRKRYSDIKCAFFPDDVQKVGRDTSFSCTSSAKNWEKCGDSFVDTPVTKNLRSSGRKLSEIRKLALSHALAQTSAAHCNEDPVHIAWSSSDSESNDDCKHLQSQAVAQQQQRPQRLRKPTAPVQSFSRALHILSSAADDLPVIDTDSDLNDSEYDIEENSVKQISDCDSEPDGEENLTRKAALVAELEITGYDSDGENTADTSSRWDSESVRLQIGEGSKRSVSDWVRSAQAMLQTPQKQFDRQPRTPEDSAKKKRKFQSGGLAERLNRLQCRQKSAISFWRHQSTSGAVTTVDRPGVLVLEVLEVQEECSMQVVHCEHHQPPREGHQHSHPGFKAGDHVLVLFNRETAAQLVPAPGDIIHIYPPWQSLSIEGFSCSIILNTHFSQKVSSASKLGNMPIPRGLLLSERCVPYTLGQIFGLAEICRTPEETSSTQVAAPHALCSFGSPGVMRQHCNSLLEAIEGLGQAGSVGQDVEVVVQRVYSVPVPDWTAASILKPRVPPKSSTALPPEKGKTRLCVLVQDSYGMFSVVQLHVLPCKDQLHQYGQMWQGKTCILRGIKVVQRVTRERCFRLFSLIDSLWRSLMSVKEHGSTASLRCPSRPSGPAPSFCYILTGQESSVEPTERPTVSPLYVPPSHRTLRDILQSELTTCRCSFVATIIYKKMEHNDVGQTEVWIVLTDPSLQEEQLERQCRRTVALCVKTSCVLTSPVLKALNSSPACSLSFTDALKEHGVLLCVEQSVIQMWSVETKSSLSESLSTSQAQTLPQPVRLDPLDLEISPNTLCSLTGVVVGVDESTAYCWPVCSHCGSDHLKLLSERPQTFHCVCCKSAVQKPTTRIQLEVFLSSSLNNCTIKVKLQQKTIMSILNTTALEGTEFPGYDVENVLGKEVGPIAAYVRVITRKPSLWVGLEEISL
ncbi:DNA repair-scaffolding protein isoform X2 [Thalassophryne amazonica]|uniref:DNA repair-scaffolding protein isoform X2 n=1 Tax=Thalassophryne amazonica TaxID=390379 RepID=UPI0014721170|nr:DNA repair-scaffolding protein isoform X2 [Thalassophryne amazonica]